MIAVIFEVEPADGQMNAYLDVAGPLRAELEKIPGFISVERFQSLTDPKKLLSLSFFENEEAVTAWRNLPVHRAGQSAGRNKLFAGYRLRVAHVLRDYGKEDRAEAPADSRPLHG